jgi:hypothetical protein
MKTIIYRGGLILCTSTFTYSVERATFLLLTRQIFVSEVTLEKEEVHGQILLYFTTINSNYEMIHGCAWVKF